MITDFDMPIMNGSMLAGRLPVLPVIRISGSNDARITAQECPNIYKMIIKLYHRKDLMDGIREILHNGNKHA